MAGFTRRGDIVLDNKWVVGKDFGHIAHSHVVTAYAAQGRSVKTAFVSMNAATAPAIRKDVFYVGASRGKRELRIYTNDKEELRENASRSEERVSAIQLQQKRRSPIKQFWKTVYPQIQKYAQLKKEVEHGREREF